MSLDDAEKMALQLARWKFDALTFVREAFGVEPDEWQKDALRAMVEHDLVACIACKGPGKTALEAWVGWWWMVTRPKAEAIATSVTRDNLRDGLWKELGKWYAKGELLQVMFEMSGERILMREDPIEWWLSARSWPKGADATEQANTLAGLHGDHMLFLGDEAGGYPPGIIPAAMAIRANLTPGSGREAKILLCGNPEDPNGPLYAISTIHRHLWHVIHVTGDPDDPKRSPRISVEWARQQIEMYGKDNPYVLVNVFGKFPPVGFNTLLGPDEVRAAIHRVVPHDDYFYSEKRIGVDVARFGDDATILFPRQGLVAFEAVEMRNARSHDIAARIVAAKSKWGSEVEFVDDTGGFGAGVIDALIQAGHAPIPVNFSSKASDPKFFNRRTEMWWEMAQWIKRGGSIPNDPQLIRELTTPTYTFQNGKIRLEEKDQIKARLGYSPDRGDSLALSFAIPDRPTSMARGYRSPAERRGDFNPISSDRLGEGRDYDPMERLG